MGPAAQPYPVFSLIIHGTLLGVLLGGFIIILYIFSFTRQRLHLTVLLLNFAGIVYCFTEGMVLVSYIIGNPALGRQFNRLQALTIAIFIVLIPAFIEATVSLPPLWKKVNRAIMILAFAFSAFLVIVAFVAPDLFISIEKGPQATTLLNTRWAEARGQPGAVYPLRDLVVVPVLLYMLVALAHQLLVRKNLRHILLPVIGLLYLILSGLFDLLYVYSTIEQLRFMKNFSSFTNLGITVFIVLSLISVVRRYQDETREIANARKTESLASLAGGIAHDFNNLLTAVIGNISLVTEKIAAGSVESGYLEDALGASIHAQELAGELLSLSRGGEPKKELFSLCALIESAHSFIPPESHIKVTCSVDPQLKNICADRTQIAQLIQNLMVNAFQAMGGVGRIDITAGNLALGGRVSGGLPAGDYARIIVHDTGPGISRPDLEKMFDPFFTTKGKGHGLGLTIARRIVTLHGGTISVESREGRGTTFTVLLPTSNEQLPVVASAARPIRALAGRVLYLEDDVIVAGAGMHMLSKLGFETDICVRGEEAVELFRKAGAEGRPYSFVLLDVVVAGGWGGIKTVKELRHLNVDLLAAATSGYSGGDIAVHYEKYGFNAFLPKPFQLSDLQKLVASLLGDGDTPVTPAPTR